MKRYSLIFILIFYLSGCATVGKRFSTDKINLIKKGVTSKQEILNIFGNPENISTDSEGRETFSYVYVKAKAKPTSFIPLLWIFSGGASTESEVLTIYFDKEGRVEDYELSSSKQDIHTGIIPKE